jgi:hypothetical protein
MNTAQKRVDRSVKSLAKTNFMNNLTSPSSSQASSKTETVLDLRTSAATGRSTLEVLKANLVRRLSEEFVDVKRQIIDQAVSEAYSLASLTAVPLLLLPTLSEEKVRTLRNAARGDQIASQHSALALAA